MNDQEKYRDELEKDIRIIEFKKKDGTTRKLVGTLNPNLFGVFPEGSKILNKPTTESTRKSNPDVIAVFDVEKEQWRSFRIDSVLSFKTIAEEYLSNVNKKIVAPYLLKK